MKVLTSRNVLAQALITANSWFALCAAWTMFGAVFGVLFLGVSPVRLFHAGAIYIAFFSMFFVASVMVAKRKLRKRADFATRFDAASDAEKGAFVGRSLMSGDPPGPTLQPDEL
ncbi:MAG: hypothetical protein AB7O98_07475 [Hyphomonadaceae bacterium]